MMDISKSAQRPAKQERGAAAHRQETPQGRADVCLARDQRAAKPVTVQQISAEGGKTPSYIDVEMMWGKT